MRCAERLPSQAGRESLAVSVVGAGVGEPLRLLVHLVQVDVRVTLLEVFAGLGVVGAESVDLLLPHFWRQPEEMLHAGFGDRVLVQVLRGLGGLVVQGCLQLRCTAGGVDEPDVFGVGSSSVGCEDADCAGGASNRSAE